MRFLALCLAALLSISGVNAALLPSQTLHYSTRTALAAQVTTALTSGDIAVISEASNEGSFKWVSTDQSSGVTTQGSQIGETYVAPNSDPTGASGAWVRISPIAARTTYTPGGTIAGTNVQTALAELESETTANLALKAPLASPTFTGIPAAPNPGGGDSSTQLATTSWVQGLISGVVGGTSNFKLSAVVSTTVAGTLASSFENGDTVNGVVLATTNRILIKDQAAQAENGLYTVNASGAPTRATDADSSGEVTSMVVPVTGGTSNSNSLWIQVTPSPTLGSSALVFSIIPSAGAYAPGNGITIVSNVVAADVADQATAEAGASTSKLMTPQRTAQAEAVFLTANLSDQSTAETGSNNTKVMTPLRARQGDAAYVTSVLANQATAEAGSNNVTVMTPLRAEQHSAAWLNRTFDATSAAFATKTAGSSAGVPPTYKSNWRYVDTTTTVKDDTAAGACCVYSTVGIYRYGKGIDYTASPTSGSAGHTDLALHVMSRRGTGDDASYLTDTQPGQVIAIAAHSFMGQQSEGGAIVWQATRPYMAQTPAATIGTTNGIEGNIIARDTANRELLNIGTMVGSLPAYDNTTISWSRQGLGFRATASDDADTTRGVDINGHTDSKTVKFFSSFVVEDDSPYSSSNPDGTSDGWLYLFSGHQNSNLTPYFYITGRRSNLDVGGGLSFDGTPNSFGVIRAQASDATSPTYSFANAGREDDGMFSVAASTLGFATSGVKRLSISTTVVNSTLPIQINGTTVLTGRQAGWAADTGTDKRTANATYSAAASGTYNQTQIQTLMDAVRDATRTIKSLKADLTSEGIIGP